MKKKRPIANGDLVIWTRETRRGPLEIPAEFRYKTKMLMAIEVQTDRGPVMRFVAPAKLRAMPGQKGFQ